MMHSPACRWRTLIIALGFLAVELAASVDEFFLRVIDVGQGECVVAKSTDTSGSHYFIYDAGVGAEGTMRGIKDVIPRGSNVDLMVISHNDGDHIAGVKAIMDEYHVRRIIHPGDERDTEAYRRTRTAILNEVTIDHCVNFDLSKKAIKPGASISMGNMVATIVSGFSRPPERWGQLDEAEANNAGSIIVRLSYKGKQSILLCGDAVGRHRDSPPGTCIAAEREIVDRAPTVTIKSDVVVAPHHGANNGSSEDFIRAVSPKYVIFSAGHSANYKHPTKAAAERYLAAGVDVKKMFRTDLGDDEGPEEWDVGRIPNSHDASGDDDVEVKVSNAGVLTVGYRTH
jgi:competence protein ComEC